MVFKLVIPEPHTRRDRVGQLSLHIYVYPFCCRIHGGRVITQTHIFVSITLAIYTRIDAIIVHRLSLPHFLGGSLIDPTSTMSSTPAPELLDEIVSNLEQLGMSRPVALSALEVRPWIRKLRRNGLIVSSPPFRNVTMIPHEPQTLVSDRP